MESLKEFVDQYNKTWDTFKSTNDSRLEKIEKKMGGLGQIDEKLDKIHADLDAKLKAYQDKLAEIEALQKAAPDPKKDAGSGDQKMKYFYEWCRKGDKASPDAIKGLTSTVDTEGGYLAPDEFNREIIKGLTVSSPIRSVSWVKQTSAKASKFPKRTAQFSATWVAEVGTRSETTGLAYGLEEIPNHELYAYVPLSQEELEDSAFNMEAELRSEFIEQFAVAEGTAFCTGSGSGRPQGLSIGITDTMKVTGSDTSTSLVTDTDLIAMYFKVKQGYARNGTFFANRNVLKRIRSLQYSTTGEYMMGPLTGGMAPTILGRPYFEAPDLDDDGTTDNLVAFFGDFKRGYAISDRIQIGVLRDPYSSATTGQVRFIARRRVGGQVVLEEALCKLVCG